jgi:competence protein ComEC
MTLGLLPLLLALFQQFSLVSPFANALAIPVVSMAVTPLALLGCLPGFAWALDLAHGLLAPLMAFLQWLAGWPGAVWQQHAPPPWAVPVALLGAAWLLLPRGFPARRLGLVLFLPLFLIPPARPAPGEMTFTLLDVGQGQAVHVQTATRDLMFDAGPDFGGAADAGSRILVPYLRAAGVARLDRLIVSHADRDHAGGAASLLAAVPVGETLSSLQKSALAGSSWEKMAVPTFVKAHASVANVMPEQKSALAGRWCVDGESWEWDGVRFAILHPAPADYARKLPSNAMSCVLKIESAHGSVLIPGDLEGRAEAELLARHAGALHADVLVAPHHGGKRTSTPEFVAAVGAQEVLFPVGYRNRFGHPYADVLARYAASGARIHRTDADGAVRVAFDGAAAQIRHEREAARRYWHNAPLQPSGKPP